MQQAPYSVHLDPDTARNFASNGATILLLDVPPGTPIGLDQQVFLSGPRFRGVKMLPPGPHFLSYQAISSSSSSSSSAVDAGSGGGGPSPPVGTFLHLAPRQVVVRRWDASAEGLAPLGDEDEEARFAAGVARFDFDAGLAPYDLHSYTQWVALSSHISAALLRALLPPGGELSIMCEALDPSLSNPNSAAEQRLQQQLQDGQAWLQARMQVERPADTQQQQQQQQQQEQAPLGAVDQVARGGRCNYTPLPRLIKLPGAPAAQLTALNMDKTGMLEQAMARYTGNTAAQQQQQPANRATGGQQGAGAGSSSIPGIALLGELQFAFIAFVFGQSLEGYMQWKQLLVLLLGCVAGPLQSHCELFVAFLTAVTAQLSFGLGAPAAPTGTGADADADASSIASSPLSAAGLADELLPDSFLRGAFRSFFEMLQEEGSAAPAALLAQARVLERVLESGLGWDFRLCELRLGSDGEGDDEDGPVVVDLSEQQQLDALAAAGYAVLRGD